MVVALFGKMTSLSRGLHCLQGDGHLYGVIVFGDCFRSPSGFAFITLHFYAAEPAACLNRPHFFPPALSLSAYLCSLTFLHLFFSDDYYFIFVCVISTYYWILQQVCSLTCIFMVLILFVFLHSRSIYLSVLMTSYWQLHTWWKLVQTLGNLSLWMYLASEGKIHKVPPYTLYLITCFKWKD